MASTFGRAITAARQNAALDAPEFDTEDARAFCRLFAGCVHADQVIMCEKTFMRATHVSEAKFHDELERLHPAC